jgi:hypothetical protein
MAWELPDAGICEACCVVSTSIVSFAKRSAPGFLTLHSFNSTQAFADGTPGSLSDVGITTDTALFLEPKT